MQPSSSQLALNTFMLVTATFPLLIHPFKGSAASFQFLLHFICSFFVLMFVRVSVFGWLSVAACQKCFEFLLLLLYLFTLCTCGVFLYYTFCCCKRFSLQPVLAYHKRDPFIALRLVPNLFPCVPVFLLRCLRLHVSFHFHFEFIMFLFLLTNTSFVF